MLPPIEFFMAVVTGGILGYFIAIMISKPARGTPIGLATWLRNQWGPVRN
jgi:hypothetical protein